MNRLEQGVVHFTVDRCATGFGHHKVRHKEHTGNIFLLFLLVRQRLSIIKCGPRYATRNRKGPIVLTRHATLKNTLAIERDCLHAFGKILLSMKAGSQTRHSKTHATRDIQYLQKYCARLSSRAMLITPESMHATCSPTRHQPQCYYTGRSLHYTPIHVQSSCSGVQY